MPPLQCAVGVFGVIRGHILFCPNPVFTLTAQILPYLIA